MSNLDFNDERIFSTPIVMFADYINLQFTDFLKKNYKDITPRDFTYLVNIFYHENVSQRKLANLLFVSESNVAQIIKKLEKKGLVCRRISEENKSKKILNLTQDGIDIMIAVLNNVFELEDKFENRYSSDEFKSFKKILYEYADESTYFD